MTKIALFGAGGKTGMRRSWNLMESDHDVLRVEVSTSGEMRLQEETGLPCVDPGLALSYAIALVGCIPTGWTG